MQYSVFSAVCFNDHVRHNTVRFCHSPSSNTSTQTYTSLCAIAVQQEFFLEDVLLQTGYLDTLGSSSSSSNRKSANGYGNGSAGGKSLPSLEELSSSLVPPTAPTFACVLCGKRGFRCVACTLCSCRSVAVTVVCSVLLFM
jgi:hypothetical protein